jgi:hypothetical protein
MFHRKPLRALDGSTAAWWLVPVLVVAALLAAVFLARVLADLPPAERALAAAPAGR